MQVLGFVCVFFTEIIESCDRAVHPACAGVFAYAFHAISQFESLADTTRCENGGVAGRLDAHGLTCKTWLSKSNFVDCLVLIDSHPRTLTKEFAHIRQTQITPESQTVLFQAQRCLPCRQQYSQKSN